MSKKFLMAIIGMVAVVGVALGWIILGVKDVGLWGLWFAALNALIGIYAGANVATKKVISQNYKPELDDKVTK